MGIAIWGNAEVFAIVWLLAGCTITFGKEGVVAMSDELGGGKGRDGIENGEEGGNHSYKSHID